MGNMYMIRAFVNCKTPAVVYMGIGACPRVYVGETIGEFRRQILEHVGDIEHRRDTAVATREGYTLMNPFQSYMFLKDIFHALLPPKTNKKKTPGPWSGC